MFGRLRFRHLALHLGSALLAVTILCAIPVISAPGLRARPALALLLPAGAATCCLVGFIWKVWRWMRAPIAFRIALTTGQHRTLSSMAHDRSRCPHTAGEVVLRVLLDVVLFRPLWRATPSARQYNRKLSGYAGRLLWLLAAAFHGSLAVVALRHLRFFLTPVPHFISWLQSVDSLSDLFVPKVHATSFLLLLALGMLIGRRLVLPRLRYISLAADYFPLLLIAGIASTGVLMRHVTRTDIPAVKAMVTNLAALSGVHAQPLDTLVLVHVFLVSALLAYFPLSKLMHMPGAFMSPTLTLADNSRAIRHINVRNPQVQFLHYADYEATFRERMIEAGLPVEEP